jgi:hypothetical protein
VTALVLANAYQQADPGRASVAYQAASDLAALGASVGDAARADVSLQTARGYGSIDKPWLTPLLVEQAENLARFSLTLLPAQRRDIWRAGQKLWQTLPGLHLPRPEYFPTGGALCSPADPGKYL